MICLSKSGLPPRSSRPGESGLVDQPQDCYPNLNQIRIYVLTDRQAKAKNFKSREVSGKTVKLEVMDIERLHRHWSEGKPRDELVVNFEEAPPARPLLASAVPSFVRLPITPRPSPATRERSYILNT
jgi:hypothetical protein